MSKEYSKKYKKYRWLVLIVVPVAVALIQITPSLMKKNNRSNTGNTGNTGNAWELEPNNDILHANVIPLKTKVQSIITDNPDGSPDNDYFRFTTSPIYQDIIQVIVENRSTTLMPELHVFDSMKSDISGRLYDTTKGANLTHSFSAEPNSTYYIQVNSWSGHGSYRVVIKPLQAYDKYEQNDDILHAKPISIGISIDASIMDDQDVDFYQVKTSPQASAVAVKVLKVLIENRSTTLMPELHVFDSMKSDISGRLYDTTKGANLTHSFSAKPNSIYYIQVNSWSGYGHYTITVK